MEQMEYFEKNMQALKERNQALYQAIREYIPGNPEYCPELVQAKDGTNITKIKKDEKEWFLNSQYRPMQEAEKFAEQYQEVIDFSFMTFMGFGNGILARQLRQRMGEHIVFLFYEPSVEVFLHTLSCYNISDLLVDENIFITIEDLNKKATQQILKDNIKFDNYMLAIYDALPKYRQLFLEEYQWLEDLYQQAVIDVLAYIETQQEFGRSMAENTILNMRHLLNCNFRDEFNGIFPTDIPAVVVAAGPSLEKNVHVLKQMKGKALVVAVDTALRYLAEHGVSPDLAITVDARKPLRLFETEEVRNMQLVIDCMSNYRVVDLLSGQKIIVSGGNYVYYKDIFDIVGQRFRFLRNGGSVATVAFSLLREWGFERIVLVGQDLALAANKVHAGKDDVDLHKLTGGKIAVEGYYGDTVYTTWDYNEYRKWLEMMIEEEDCPEVINATEGGAKIAGAVQMSLQAVMDTYCGKTFDFEKAIQDVPPTFTEADFPQLLALWNGSVRNLEQLKRRFKEGIQLLEEQSRLITRGNYTKGDMQNIQKRLDKIFAECDAYTETQLVDSLIATEQERILDDLYEMEESNEEESCRLLEKLKDYLAAMADATDKVKDLFQLVIDEMTE